MDLDKIKKGLKYHTSIEQKESNLDKLLKNSGWFSPRQNDMKQVYLEKITYHTSIEQPSIMEQLEKSLNIK